MVKTNEGCFLYPFPVKKENKYLIKVEESFAQFYIKAIELNYLTSPDEDESYLAQIAVHSDGNTPILEVKQEELIFNLLSHRQKDLKKAETIEKIISGKIMNVLSRQENAINDLFHKLEKQKECSVCQELGIGDERLLSWLNLLR